MNKDIKGLLKYLLIMLVIWLMPLGMLYCGLLAYGLSDHYNDYFAIVFLLLGLVLFILYFILPIIFTYKAMKYHWSKYLDIFFYNKWLPTIVLIFFVILHLTEHIFHYSDGSSQLILGIIYVLFYIIEIFIATTYYLTYILMLIMRVLELL